MTEKEEKNLLKIRRLLSKGKPEKAISRARSMAEKYIAQGMYLQAVAVWKSVLQADPCQVEAHLWLTALQEQLQLWADAEMQRSVLEDLCRRAGITTEEVEALKTKLGIKTLRAEEAEES